MMQRLPLWRRLRPRTHARGDLDRLAKVRQVGERSSHIVGWWTAIRFIRTRRFGRLPVVSQPVCTIQIVRVNQVTLLRRVEPRITAPPLSPDRRRFVVLARSAFAIRHAPKILSAAKGAARAVMQAVPLVRFSNLSSAEWYQQRFPGARSQCFGGRLSIAWGGETLGRIALLRSCPSLAGVRRHVCGELRTG